MVNFPSALAIQRRRSPTANGTRFSFVSRCPMPGISAAKEKWVGLTARAQVYLSSECHWSESFRPDVSGELHSPVVHVSKLHLPPLRGVCDGRPSRDHGGAWAV